MPKTIQNYVICAKSYFKFNDISISDDKFEARVSVPQAYKEDIEALDSNDIIEILHHCDNKRLKAYLLVLASGGLRAMEALAIRECDIDWNDIDFADANDKLKAVGLHVRKEFSKTKWSRDIFISNEAGRYLNDWLEWKYRLQGKGSREAGKEDLVFARVKHNGHATGLYNKMVEQFRRALEKAGYGSRKEEGVYKKRNISLHSFRRFAKTTISNRARNSDYSEWFLGHAGSTYWRTKPEERRAIYEEDCRKFLTFFDYPSMQEIGKSLDAKMKRLEKENQDLNAQLKYLKESKESNNNETTNAMADLTQTVKQLQKEIAEIKAAKQS
jgi:integrase